MPHPAVQSDILVVHFHFTDEEISGILALKSMNNYSWPLFRNEHKQLTKKTLEDRQNRETPMDTRPEKSHRHASTKEKKTRARIVRARRNQTLRA